MIKHKKKNQKPIESDAQFRYKCPNDDCGFDYWLNIKQCKTKNFKVVCDCGTVFKPKQIFDIKIIYAKSSRSKKTHSTTNTEQTKQQKEVPENLRNSSIRILCSYGFTELEADNLISKGFEKNPIEDVSGFIKYIIENIKILESDNE